MGFKHRGWIFLRGGELSTKLHQISNHTYRVKTVKMINKNTSEIMDQYLGDDTFKHILNTIHAFDIF